VVVDLHPLDLADGRHPDEGTAVGEFLVTVLVVQRGIPAPGRLEGIGERGRGGRVDERGADVLAVRLRGSISLVILVRRPSGPVTTFISSSASRLTSSTASTMPACPAAPSSVFSTETGCTVSPLTSSAPAAKCSRASQSE
jgi:hypothetical protein